MTLGIFLSSWERIRAKLIETIDCFEDEDLSFSPRSGLWTVRELMIHIAHEEMGEMGYGISQKLQEWPENYNPGDFATIGDIKDLLSEVHKDTLEYLATLSDADLGHMVATPWGEEYQLGDMI